MKTLQKFQCEVCHTEYAKKEDCQKCEKGHKKAGGDIRHPLRLHRAERQRLPYQRGHQV